MNGSAPCCSWAAIQCSRGQLPAPQPSGVQDFGPMNWCGKKCMDIPGLHPRVRAWTYLAYTHV
eukprot:361197-Chlamydomonas_euryale.AAC.2